jgi:nucleobase:cation symporter-1, NCS1 family
VNLYYLAFPLGFVVSFLTHWSVNTVLPPAGLGEKDEDDIYGTFTVEEARRLGIAGVLPQDNEDEGTDEKVPSSHVKGATEP